jgi:hypothetical protein
VHEERKPAEQDLAEQDLAEQDLAEQDSCRPSGDEHELNSKETKEVCIKAPGLQSSGVHGCTKSDSQENLPAEQVYKQYFGTRVFSAN